MEDVRDFLLEALEEGKELGYDNRDFCEHSDVLAYYGERKAYERVLALVEEDLI